MSNLFFILMATGSIILFILGVCNSGKIYDSCKEKGGRVISGKGIELCVSKDGRILNE